MLVRNNGIAKRENAEKDGKEHKVITSYDTLYSFNVGKDLKKLKLKPQRKKDRKYERPNGEHSF